MIDEERIEEILETIWMLREERKSSIEDLKKNWEGTDFNEIFEKIKDRLYININKNKIDFTQKGEEKARVVVRRHRLAENLFSLVLTNIREEKIESTACSFEHILDLK